MTVCVEIGLTSKTSLSKSWRKREGGEVSLETEYVEVEGE